MRSFSWTVRVSMRRRARMVTGQTVEPIDPPQHQHVLMKSSTYSSCRPSRRLELDRGHALKRSVEPFLVVELHPFRRGDLELAGVTPWSERDCAFGLYKPLIVSARALS